MGKTTKNNTVKKDKKEAKTSSKSLFNRYYIGFHTRVFISAIVFLVSLFISILTLSRSFTISKEQMVNYQENSNIDYKVYLKKNDFYEEEYLGKDRIYVASLINKIDVDFNYNFKMDIKSDVDFTYDVVGTLVISDTNGNNIFFQKDYNLLEKSDSSIIHGTFNNIKKTVSIDYNYYNNLANKFRNNYGIEATSNLIVKFRIIEESKDEKLNLKDNNEMSLTIPLSQKAVNINMNYKEINDNKKVVSEGKFEISNYIYVGEGLLALLIAMISLIKLFNLLSKTLTKDCKYDKYIKKILKEYDRLIVNTTTPPDLENKKVVNINSFNELLDVRDNLKLPIKYCVITKHQKCNFYITHDEEIYLLVVKSVDVENKK